MIHNDYKEMIPVHALAALDAADEHALHEHLAGCDECRRELAQWEATAATLALSADPMEPAPQVREKLLAQIRSEKSASNVLPFKSPPRNLWQRLGSLGSVAAVLAFAALLVLVIVLWQQNRRLRQENEVVQILSSPRATVKNLNGTTEAPTASAKVVIDSQGHALLIANGLPQPPRGKEYQLWIINPKQPPKPGRTFSTDSAGKGIVVQDHVWEVEREYGVFAITLEPAGGVESPTGAIYLRSDL